MWTVRGTQIMIWVVGLVLVALTSIEVVIGYIFGSALFYGLAYLEFRAMWEEIGENEEDE